MTVPDILDGITQLSALVIGDICLDRWCRYDPSTSEPSRETGIPRIGVVRTAVTPGASGTIASNLTALLTKQVAVLGVIGNDGFGVELERALIAREISPELVVKSDTVPTFTYTKLINADTEEEDQPRVDFIYTRPMPSDVEEGILAHLRGFWGAFDVIIVCDQAETEHGGVITPKIREAISELAAGDNKVVWVDSRMRAEHFRNVIIKTNVDEASAACRRAFASDLDLDRLAGHTRAKMLVTTEGPRGATYHHKGVSKHVPTRHIEKPVDICGAGDSFSAGASLALTITGDPEQALRFGNMVSSITVMKKGTGIATPAEVLLTASSWPE